MKESELRKLIREEILNEGNWKPLVGKVSTACGWNYNDCQDFIRALLIDINHKDEAKKVWEYMNKI